jgi:putative phosphonate metabolism protein
MLSTMSSNLGSNAGRYAIYFAPSQTHALWRTGNCWLGRDAQTGQRLQQSIDRVATTLFQTLTSTPRRYGWHATLKAPFALVDGVKFEDLDAALHSVCRQADAFVMPPLTVGLLGDFLALRPQSPSAEIQAVSDSLVTKLHGLAANLSEAELRRRRAAGLTAVQDQYLLHWGYPYVLSEFRFHMSLTGSLEGVAEETMTRLMLAARQRFESLPPCPFDNVALFFESHTGADFRLVKRYPLAK